MKKIEAIVNSDGVPKILEVLKQNGIKGLTLTQSLGSGSGDHPWIGGPKGHEIEFNTVSIITIIMDDSQVEKAIQLIVDSGSTGSPSDGKIFISSIDDAVDINTKQRGIKAIV